MKYIVGFSGGIDSQAAATVAIERFGAENVILLSSDTGQNEHPLTTAFIGQFSRNVHRVIVVTPNHQDFFFHAESRDRESEFRKARARAIARNHDPDAPLSFLQMTVLKKRAPSRRAQFCTGILKLNPSIRWIHENVGTEFERCSGLRRDESDNRKDTPDEEFDDRFQCRIHHLVYDWTKQQCFDFVASRGQQVNDLYRLGFKRVGCRLCINSSRADIRNWAKRFPEVIGEIRHREAVTGRTYFAPMVPGLEINWIDQVVAWANCERGGRQYSLEVLIPSPVCESAFGLCG